MLSFHPWSFRHKMQRNHHLQRSEKIKTGFVDYVQQYPVLTSILECLNVRDALALSYTCRKVYTATSKAVRRKLRIRQRLQPLVNNPTSFLQVLCSTKSCVFGQMPYSVLSDEQLCISSLEVLTCDATAWACYAMRNGYQRLDADICCRYPWDPCDYPVRYAKYTMKEAYRLNIYCVGDKQSNIAERIYGSYGGCFLTARAVVCCFPASLCEYDETEWYYRIRKLNELYSRAPERQTVERKVDLPQSITEYGESWIVKFTVQDE